MKSGHRPHTANGISPADNPYLLDADQPNSDKVVRIAWFNYEEIEQLAADGQLSDPELVLSAARAERDHISIPDEVITQYQSKYAHNEPL